MTFNYSPNMSRDVCGSGFHVESIIHINPCFWSKLSRDKIQNVDTSKHDCIVLNRTYLFYLLSYFLYWRIFTLFFYFIHFLFTSLFSPLFSILPSCMRGCWPCSRCNDSISRVSLISRRSCPGVQVHLVIGSPRSRDGLTLQQSGRGREVSRVH